MKKADIKVGGVYETRVDGVWCKVKITGIEEKGKITSFRFLNPRTNKKGVYQSAARFRPVPPAPEVKTPDTRANGKPRLKLATVPGLKGRTNTGTIKPKPEEGKQSSDPSSVATVSKTSSSVAVPNTTAASGECLGYDPSAVTGRCRCKVCLTKPRAERTFRPFVDAKPVPPSSPGAGSSTKLSVPSSPQTGPPTKTSSPSEKLVVSKTDSDISIHPVLTGVKTSVLGSLGQETFQSDNAPNIVIVARAGTGKTTTGIEGLKEMLGFGTHLIPSPQQKAIWDSLCLSKGVKTIGYTSFSNIIVDELKRRVPPGVEALTMHSLGFKAINAAFRLWGGTRSVNDGRERDSHYRTKQIVAEILRTNIDDLFRRRGVFLSAVCELVGYCKVNLVGPWGKELVCDGYGTGAEEMYWNEMLDTLVDHFDVDLDGTSRDEVYPLVPKVLERSLDVGRDRFIDFNDMIWLPIVLNLPVRQYDLLMVDEAQDLNRAQQLLAERATQFGRLVFCGDDRQAIYGFAGADCESMERTIEKMKQSERGVVVLKLTMTRRCGKSIVREAQKIVDDFEAHPDNPEGLVRNTTMEEYLAQTGSGDMVLCRVNAPLVSQCFKLIKMGKKANIRGRKIGENLVKTVQKQKAENVADLISKLETWCENEIEKQRKRKNPNEDKIINLQDTLDCILCFVEGLDPKDSPAVVVSKIQSVFTDNKDMPGIMLSSIHKAKGLEAKRVFLLEPEGATVPHPMARSPWQKKQEWNLRYVAETRAIEELVYVS